jgi:dUTP pyrophosphatase
MSVSDACARQNQLFSSNRLLKKIDKTIKVKIIKDWSLLANLPSKSHDSDAGWDLYSVEGSFELQPGERYVIHTGIAFEIPKGFVGLIWPRSGLSVKKGVDVLAGVVDSGYRGEVRVCLLNTGSEPCKIDKGDRIAQILFQEVPEFSLEVVEDFSNSDRGDNGFGSSGN